MEGRRDCTASPPVAPTIGPSMQPHPTATPLLLTLLAGVGLSWAGHLPPWPVGILILAGAFGFALAGGRA